ncbi:hypothetical protein N0V90_002007 [Kalmusia sp. IMI 367209]|nr:hypothetical protein N0V90_002007 [Kalmusia sp. IMI 367209]
MAAIPDSSPSTIGVAAPRAQDPRFFALSALEKEMGDKANVLNYLPFELIRFRENTDHGRLHKNAAALPYKIEVGTIEDEAKIRSLLYAYMLTNSTKAPTPEIAFFSFPKARKPGHRHSADEVIARGSLREEFKNFSTRQSLCAAMRVYFFRKGAVFSTPVAITNSMAVEIERACRKYAPDNGKDSVKCSKPICPETSQNPTQIPHRESSTELPRQSNSEDLLTKGAIAVNKQNTKMISPGQFQKDIHQPLRSLRDEKQKLKKKIQHLSQQQANNGTHLKTIKDQKQTLKAQLEVLDAQEVEQIKEGMRLQVEVIKHEKDLSNIEDRKNALMENLDPYIKELINEGREIEREESASKRQRTR